MIVTNDPYPLPVRYNFSDDEALNARIDFAFRKYVETHKNVRVFVSTEERRFYAEDKLIHMCKESKVEPFLGAFLTVWLTQKKERVEVD